MRHRREPGDPEDFSPADKNNDDVAIAGEPRATRLLLSWVSARR